MLQHVILEEDPKLRSVQSPATEMRFKWIFMSEEPYISIKYICMYRFYLLLLLGFFLLFVLIQSLEDSANTAIIFWRTRKETEKSISTLNLCYLKWERKETESLKARTEKQGKKPKSKNKPKITENFRAIFENRVPIFPTKDINLSSLKVQRD